MTSTRGIQKADRKGEPFVDVRVQFTDAGNFKFDVSGRFFDFEGNRLQDFSLIDVTMAEATGMIRVKMLGIKAMLKVKAADQYPSPDFGKPEKLPLDDEGLPF
jgi:hypothetical protein